MEDPLRAFVRRMGELHRRLGHSDLYGRFVALMLTHDRPLTLAQAAGALGVSKAAVSKLVQPMLDAGDLKLSDRLSTREHAYELSDTSYTRAIRDVLDACRDVALACRELVERSPGLPGVVVKQLRNQAEVHARMVIEGGKVVGPLEEVQAADLKRHLEEDWDALPSGPSSTRAQRRHEPKEGDEVKN